MLGLQFQCSVIVQNCISHFQSPVYRKAVRAGGHYVQRDNDSSVTVCLPRRTGRYQWSVSVYTR